MINKIILIFAVINLPLLANQTFEEIILEELNKQHDIIELDEMPKENNQPTVLNKKDEKNLRTTEKKICRINNLIEAKVGYFRPTGSPFRTIYGGGVMYGIEGTFRLYKDLYLWADANYFSKSGVSTVGRNSTRIKLVPLGIGLKYLFRVNQRGDGVYLAAGVLPGYAHTHDTSPYLITSMSAWGVGGAFKAGFLVTVYRFIVFDFFVDYKYLKVAFKKDNCSEDMVIYCNKSDASGLMAGFGFGFKF